MKTYSNLSLTAFLFIFFGCFALFVVNIVTFVYFAIDLSKLSKNYWIQCNDEQTLLILSIVGLITTALPLIILLIILMLFKKEKFYCIFPFVIIIGFCVAISTIAIGLLYSYTKNDELIEDKFEEMITNYNSKKRCNEEITKEFDCLLNEDSCIQSFALKINDIMKSISKHSFALMITLVILDVITLLGICLLFMHFPCGMLHEVRRLD